MYFPIGWPTFLRIEEDCKILHLACSRDRILLAVVTDIALGLWYCKPSVKLAGFDRSAKSIVVHGTNRFVVWKPDCTGFVIITTKGHALFFTVDFDGSVAKGLYTQKDSRNPNLRRESAELFVKDAIPAVKVKFSTSVVIPNGVVSATCIRDELVLTTETGHLERYRWDGSINLDYTLDLQRIPFSVNHQHSKAIPIQEAGVFVRHVEYSPIVGGFAVVLSDGRAALLTAPTLKFDPNQVEGIWCPELSDAWCVSVNHRYRLLAFGRKCGEGIVYCLDDMTGSLVVSQKLQLTDKGYPDSTDNPVISLSWTPDGYAICLAYSKGGYSVWSVFGSLLHVSLAWEVSGAGNMAREHRLYIRFLEWGVEGYQLWTILSANDFSEGTRVGQIQFLKSALTSNPCMSNMEHMLLQGEDRIYLNAALPSVSSSVSAAVHSKLTAKQRLKNASKDPCLLASTVSNKHWIVIPISTTYMSTNWPIRYCATNASADLIAVAGRSGVTHYCTQTRRWKLFGNETQERDFIVTGGLIWWQDYLILGCYNVPENKDEIRMYPKSAKLDNVYVSVCQLPAQILLLNLLNDKLLVFCADNHISLFAIETNSRNALSSTSMTKIQDIDVTSLSIHPACVVFIALTTIRTELIYRHRHPSCSNDGSAACSAAARELETSMPTESILINVSGRLMFVQRSSLHACNSEDKEDYTPVYLHPTVVASSVECVWLCNRPSKEKLHLVDALWINCGVYGIRVWLPLYLTDKDKPLNFMSRRIMLPFSVQIYPLAVLFEEAVIVGCGNDVVLNPQDGVQSEHSFPYSIIERTSQVYLHNILRQLLRRNLGFYAWEIARSCSALEYFPHSLELLLHEVLEEEATSKEPIPDPLLPRVVDFVREFPVHLKTIVQCARKTEIALWQHLFSVVGNPRQLFMECLERHELDVAASYLIILQSTEPLSSSRQQVIQLLDLALDSAKWTLARELIRFLKAVDPNECENPATRCLPVAGCPLTTPPISPADTDFTLPLIGRSRALSTNIPPSKGHLGAATSAGQPSPCEIVASTANDSKIWRRGASLRCESVSVSEEPFLELVLQRHARKLLLQGRLKELGYFAAHLDFHVVSWLRKEKYRAARVDDALQVLRRQHHDFGWPYPLPQSSDLASSLCLVNSASCGNLIDRTKSLSVNTPSSDEFPMFGRPFGSKMTRDSGYLSQSNDGLLSNNSPMMEALLRPRNYHRDDSSLATQQEYSEEDSSLWDDADNLCADDDSLWPSNLIPHLQLLTTDFVSSRGPPHAEVQLRYLLQILQEAECLELCLILAILLQDVLAVVRLVNAASQPDIPDDVIRRLRDSFITLQHWAETECLGYRSFMTAIHNQITSVKNAAQQRTKPRSNSNPTPPLTPTTPTSITPTNSNRKGSMPADLATRTGSSQHESDSSTVFDPDMNLEDSCGSDEKRLGSTSPVSRPKTPENDKTAVSTEGCTIS